MDIFILRNGKESGPFPEEELQSMLKQGAVLINDLAWKPGLPDWLPLHAVLYPAAQPSALRPPPPPTDVTPPAMPVTSRPASVASAATPAKPPIALGKPAVASVAEPATARQKAFLSYMGIPFPSDLSREQAALLVNTAMENPKDTGRLQRWNEDRLRLHPDLFAEEIRTRKENRANYFYELCQGEGAEFFEKVTKAHTQVLVGYLDVRFPNWDVREEDAKYSYFFPAIAEKFPQLLTKGAKGKFKYPDGPKVAPELAARAGAIRKGRGAKSSPLAAMLKGVVFGALILGGGFLAWNLRTGREVAPSETPAAEAGAPTVSSAGVRPTVPLPSVTKAPIPASSPVDTRTASAVASTSGAATKPAGSPTREVAPVELKRTMSEARPLEKMAPGTPTPPENPVAKMDIFGAPDIPASSAAAPKGVATVSNPFDPLAPTAAVPIAPKEPVGPAPRMTVKLTKPTMITLRFGSSTQRAGTVLPLVSVEGTTVKVKIGSEVVAIPAGNTDINDRESLTAAPLSPP